MTLFDAAIQNLTKSEVNFVPLKPIPCGKVERLAGLTVRVSGLSAEIGSVCKIHVNSGRDPVSAEVIGFDSDGYEIPPSKAIRYFNMSSSLNVVLRTMARRFC